MTAVGPPAWPAGLWPVVERAGRRFALDAEEASSDGEWPVVEVSDRGVDRVGTSFLRFLHVLCAELAAAARPDADAAIALASRALPPRSRARRPLARRSPSCQEQAGAARRIDATLAAALRAATPPTPALMLALGMRAVRHEDWTARCARSRMRSRSSRWARATTTRGSTRRRWSTCSPPSAATRWPWPRRAACWARRPSATAAFWRGEALQAIAGRSNRRRRSTLALASCTALVPEDPDAAKLHNADAGAARGVSKSLQRAREALEAGRPDAGRARGARARSAPGPAAELGARRRFSPRR